MVNSIVLILAITFFIILAGLFAGAETGLYQLSRLRLRLGVEKKQLSFVILGKITRDSPGLLLSMLIGNNLSHYLVTSIVTYIFLSKVGAEHAAELFATLVTVPALFVFSELIPKNLFFYRADFLMPYVSPVLYAFHKLFILCGAVPLLKFISGTFARLTGSPVASKKVMTTAQRHYIRAIFIDVREEEILSSIQTDIIKRLADISNISIKFVMTPLSKTQTVDINSDDSVLSNKLKRFAFTRLPVVDRGPSSIVGFINIYECLCSQAHFADLRDFVKPIRRLGADTTVSDAIQIMQNENQKIVLVMRPGHGGRERPIGILTMKDLVEELLGELSEW